MPITDRFQRIPLASIIVERETRQRREIKVDDLAKSISQVGVLQPIIITRDLVLVAGERRLAACRQLGLADIPARFVEEISKTELEIIELEENCKREDLPWLDHVKAIARVHQLYLSLDPDWTMSETAEKLSVGQPHISNVLSIAAEIEDERVQKAGTMREAYNLLRRRSARAMGDALQELLDDTAEPAPGSAGATPSDELGLPAPQARVYDLSSPAVPPKPAPLPDSILTESFLDWGPQYIGKKFNLIHCDFPYGVELFAGPQGLGAEPTRGYDDSLDLYLALLECLCRNLDRLMSVSGHLMFWYSGKHDRVTRETFARLAPTLAFTPFPLIWGKSDNAGIASDPRHGPRHIYETCLLASRGNRQIVRVVSDLYNAPTDKRLHVSTKPQPMLKHFMSMLVDENTSLLDPTAGSGAALRAADEIGAKLVLGLEIDAKVAAVANTALRNQRLMARASSASRV